MVNDETSFVKIILNILYRYIYYRALIVSLFGKVRQYYVENISSYVRREKSITKIFF